MVPLYRTGGFSSDFAVTTYCQRPFRLYHACRTIWGRGYSGSALVSETSARPMRQERGVVRDLPFRPQRISRLESQNNKCGKRKTAVPQTAVMGLGGEIGGRIAALKCHHARNSTRATVQCQPAHAPRQHTRLDNAYS